MKNPILCSALAAVAFLVAHSDGQAALTISNLNGFTVSWDGNDGDFFDPAPSPAVPNNAALASNGGVAFSNGESQFFPTHAIAHLNNGFYSNTNNSHIIGNGGTAPHYMGVLLPTTIPIASVAWGRDNGNSDSDPISGDACGGQCTDRSLGTYLLQVTTDGGANWTDVASFLYDSVGNDLVPGGAFTEFLRHEYTLEAPGGGAVFANGIRIEITDPQIAIDEIEIYAVPEPSGAALLGLGLLGLLLRRRR